MHLPGKNKTPATASAAHSDTTPLPTDTNSRLTFISSLIVVQFLNFTKFQCLFTAIAVASQALFRTNFSTHRPFKGGQNYAPRRRRCTKASTSIPDEISTMDDGSGTVSILLIWKEPPGNNVASHS